MTEKEQQGALARKHEGELQQIDSHVTQMEALFQKHSAEALRLTQEDFERMRRSLDAVRRSLSELMHAADDGWDQAKARFEQAWSDFQDHSRKMGTASEEKPTAQG